MARDVRGLIASEARRMGLDPVAVLAVAAGEGGFRNREGDIGDLSGGGSYGPFQLYAQGALPSRYRGNPAAADAWAWSLPGIRYALGKMVEVGARGLRGEAAVNTIIRKFERPADPDGSVRKAISRLTKMAGFADASAPIASRASQAFQQGPAGIVRGPNPQQALMAQQQKVGALLQMSANTISGNQGANWGIIQALQQAQMQLNLANQEVIQSESQARQDGGTTMGTGRTFEGVGSPQLQKILQVADAQIGKPYVFGGESPQEGGFDCSGLIDYAFKQAGIKLPGRLTTMTAAKMGISVKGKPLKPGDWLVRNGGPGGGHMVMYVGNGQVIAAPRTGSRVQYQPVDRFMGDGWDVRRVLT